MLLLAQGNPVTVSIGDFKFIVVFGALNGGQSFAGLIQKFEVSQIRVYERKPEFLESGPLVFTNSNGDVAKTIESDN